MRATIKDVSREAGLSIKTVSRVLNKEPRVSDEARRRVLAAVELLNFRPSAAARSLVGHRTFQIALACDNPSPFYVYEMQSGIRERCQLDAVRMIAQPYDHRSDRLIDEIESLIDTTGIDGLILTPPASDRQDVLDLLERRGVPYVRVQPALEIGRSSAVMLDNRRAAEEMTRHLLALGHRRIGFVAGHPSYTASNLRLAGFEAALAGADCPPDPVLVREGNYDFASGAAAGEALLSLRDPPTAIFASNDEMAAGVLSVAHRRGLSVPRDLSVAGFGDDAVASFVWPPLTTIRQPTRELGFQAADLLLAAPAEREWREVRYEMILRESTGRRAGGEERAA
ncbi:MAG: LacI family DNA-binding transcriptional regulator [Sphingobium sp.]